MLDPKTIPQHRRHRTRWCGQDRSHGGAAPPRRAGARLEGRVLPATSTSIGGGPAKLHRGDRNISPSPSMRERSSTCSMAPGFLRLPDRCRCSMAVCEGGLLLGLGRLRCQASDGSALGQWRPTAPCRSGLRQSKLDKDRASFLRALDDIEKTLKAKPIALAAPHRPGRELQRDQST